MVHALRTFEPTFETDIAEDRFELGEEAGVRTHARALQLRLAQSFDASSGAAVAERGERQFDVRLQVAMIVSASCLLWGAIGAAVFVVIG